MLGIILQDTEGSQLRLECCSNAASPPQRVGHRHKVQSSLRVDSLLAPLGKDEGGSVLEKAVHILPSASFEPLARYLEERSAKVEDVDGCRAR